MFVCDEANLETHGFALEQKMSVLQHDRRWQSAILARMQACYERSKCHPSVVVYSLGNEAGCGPNLEAAEQWLRAVSCPRPVVAPLYCWECLPAKKKEV